MNRKPIWICLIFMAAIFLNSTISSAAEKRALTVNDMWAMKRIAGNVLSPEGRWIVFTVTQYNMETNRSNTDLYLVSTRAGVLKRLTSNPGYDGAPAWRPDGQAIAFISTRDGSAQIYLLELSGGEAQKISDIPTGVDDFLWSPDGQSFLFSATVYPGAKSLQESAEWEEKRLNSKVQAQILDKLLYRHWNHWRYGKYSHLFQMPVDGGEIVEITPGEFDTPPIDLGSAHDFTFSPDGQEIAFVRNEEKVVATSTNNDIFIYSNGQTTKLTPNPANDNQPVYSPDGKYIAYHAMARAGFEADQYDLILFNRQTGEHKNITKEFDLDVEEIIWGPKSDKVYFNSRKKGRVAVFSIDIINGKTEELVSEHINRNISISPDGKTLYFRRQAANFPFELFAFDLRKKRTRQLTFLNKDLLAKLQMNPVEDFEFASFDNRKVHGLLVKPPFFEEGKKYPLVYLIHGGPQGMWSDDFHYRWNSQMFAAPGYVVAMVNFRGSKGYGQWFCDQVTKNWGGGPYKDLMAGLDYLLANYQYIDENRVAAAGASYGGFMINWIAGQANTSPANKFKCLVSHDGVFEQVSMYGATEELWFPEWEFGGTPYQNPELYDKWSPARYAKNFKIPTLIIHGQRDFRVPVTQGMQFFTALQRMGVPSKLLYFPDEDHFVTKPQNAKLWWKTVLGWIDEWINK